MSYTSEYLSEATSIIGQLPEAEIEAMVDGLVRLRERGGRLFVIGVGGGAGHASHAVCDFRKIAGIEAYAPTDNVAELTARVNDDGWDTSLAAYLAGSRLNDGDGVLVFSVGGGDAERGVSANLVRALDLAREKGATIFGVVGRDGGHTARVADHCVVVPVASESTVTPHTESFQALIWHLAVSHPRLRQSAMKWESLTETRTSNEDGSADR
ncbi:MAG TPA: SIS domain-containing protein [Longimicrobiales bacterium]|nr:SIS domain-containing protein [Longimicrobiales bacterium]